MKKESNKSAAKAPREGKRQRRRRAIMHAAKGLYEEKGVKNVTFDEIADAAAMSRTTIFNHFASSEDLLLSLMDEEVSDVTAFCETSDLKGTALIRAIFEFLIDDMANYPVLTGKLITGSILSESKPSSLAVIEDILRDNLPRGYNDRLKEDLIILLTGTFYGLVNHYFIRGLEFDRAAMKQRFSELTEGFLK